MEEVSHVFGFEQEGVEMTVIHTVWEKASHGLAPLLPYQTHLLAITGVLLFVYLYRCVALKVMRRDANVELQYVKSLGFKDRSSYESAMARNLQPPANSKKGSRQQDMWDEGAT